MGKLRGIIWLGSMALFRSGHKDLFCLQGLCGGRSRSESVESMEMKLSDLTTDSSVQIS
jgi:hypothetical protein